MRESEIGKQFTAETATLAKKWGIQTPYLKLQTGPAVYWLQEIHKRVQEWGVDLEEIADPPAVAGRK